MGFLITVFNVLMCPVSPCLGGGGLSYPTSTYVWSCHGECEAAQKSTCKKKILKKKSFFPPPRGQSARAKEKKKKLYVMTKLAAA